MRIRIPRVRSSWSAIAVCACVACTSTSTPVRSSAPQGAPAVASAERAAPRIEFAIVERAMVAWDTRRAIDVDGERYLTDDVRTFRFATAGPMPDDQGHPAVSFVLDPRDATAFERWTGDNFGNLLAVLVDGSVVTLATIQSALPGSGVISFHRAESEHWTEAQANDLAARIHAHGTAAPRTAADAAPFEIAEPYEPEEGSVAEIVLERTPCFGRCPTYTLAVASDGSVSYHGEKNVRAEGERTGKVDPRNFRELLAQFAAVDFLALRDAYKMPVTDLPSTILTLRVNGREKQVVNTWTRGIEDDPNLPVHEMLGVLARSVETAAKASKWVGR